MTNAQVEWVLDLSNYTLQIFKNTLDNATRSYRWVTYMNVAMFAVGLGLFVVSGMYGTFFAEDKVYPLAFSGLGAGTFVALFLTGAIAKTQNALSNLVQVEIAFMDFFEQIRMWSNYSGIPAGSSRLKDPSKFHEASEKLQLRSKETIELLQQYTESSK